MEKTNDKFMDNIRQINKALKGVEAVSYWFYAVVALVVVAKGLLSL